MMDKEWGNLDLNQGPTGYEGGGPPYHPTHTSRYAQKDKRFLLKMVIIFAEWCWLNVLVFVPLVYRNCRTARMQVFSMFAVVFVLHASNFSVQPLRDSTSTAKAIWRGVNCCLRLPQP